MIGKMSLTDCLAVGLSDYSKDIFGTVHLDVSGLLGRINTICERYADIVSSDYAEFTLEEWCAICDSLNGVIIGSADTAMDVYDAIMDAEHDRDLGRRWDVDAMALATRLTELPFAQFYSALEVVSSFWIHKKNGNWKSHEDLLEAAGAVMLPFRPDAVPLAPMSFGL